MTTANDAGGYILCDHGVNYHIYADGTQISCTLETSNSLEAIGKLYISIADLRTVCLIIN